MRPRRGRVSRSHNRFYWKNTTSCYRAYQSDSSMSHYCSTSIAIFTAHHHPLFVCPSICLSVCPPCTHTRLHTVAWQMGVLICCAYLHVTYTTGPLGFVTYMIEVATLVYLYYVYQLWYMSILFTWFLYDNLNYICNMHVHCTFTHEMIL